MKSYNLYLLCCLNICIGMRMYRHWNRNSFSVTAAGRSRLERSPRLKVGWSNPSRDIGDDHNKRMPRVTVGVAPHFSMAMSAVPRSKFAALHRQCWCLHMSEKFSSGTKNPKHTNNHTNKQTQTNKRTNEQRYFKGVQCAFSFFSPRQSCIYQHFARLYKDTERLFGCSIIYKEIRHWFRVMSKCLLVSIHVSTEWPPIQHWRTTWLKRTKKRVMCIRVFWIWPNFSYLSHNLNFFQDSQAKSTMMIYFKRFKNKRIRWRVNM